LTDRSFGANEWKKVKDPRQWYSNQTCVEEGKLGKGSAEESWESVEKGEEGTPLQVRKKSRQRKQGEAPTN